MRPTAWRRSKKAALYDFFDNPHRQRSVVLDFGRGWRDVADDAATYSIHWIAGTGELYVIRTPDDAPHRYVVPGLARVSSRWESEGLTVEVLGSFRARADLENTLRGWEEFMPLPDSLSWVREQVGET
jgi:hypothetical protein